MSRNSSRLWVWVAALGILLLVLVLPAQVFAQGHNETSTGGAKASDIKHLFEIVFAISVPIFLLVEGLIIYSIVRRLKPDEMPEQIEGNRTLEIGWTVFACVIIAVLYALTYEALQSDYTVKADNPELEPDLIVHVTAYQFNWDYEYFKGNGEKTGVITTKTLTIPAKKHVYLEIVSKDVQHSFWVPDLSGKVDAVPGRTNTLWLTADKPGTYNGSCAEFCGTSHDDMLIEVDALEPAAFDAWLAGKIAAASTFVAIGTDLQSPLPTGDAKSGAQKFSDLGCSGCHGAQDSVGPSLARIRSNDDRRAGYTDQQYLRESILEPCAYTVPGFSCDVMPNDFGQKLDAQGLADLIAYLEQNESN